jgi:hypothetical protein
MTITHEANNAKPRRGLFQRKSEPAAPLNVEEAVARTEDALREMGQTMDNDSEATTTVAPNDEPKDDPAPSVPAIAEERAQMLVTNISSQMLGELRSLRDQIDDLMRDINERRDMLREAIRAHAEYAETAIQHKLIIAESVTKLRAEFEQSKTPLPPARKVGR